MLTNGVRWRYNEGVFSERQVVFETLCTEKGWLVQNLDKFKNETTFAFEDTYSYKEWQSERVAIGFLVAIKVEPRSKNRP